MFTKINLKVFHHDLDIHKLITIVITFSKLKRKRSFILYSVRGQCYFLTCFIVFLTESPVTRVILFPVPKDSPLHPLL